MASSLMFCSMGVYMGVSSMASVQEIIECVLLYTRTPVQVLTNFSTIEFGQLTEMVLTSDLSRAVSVTHTCGGLS